MNVSAELAADVPTSREALAGRPAMPSGRRERDVSSGWLVIATIWWALLAYASVHALLGRVGEVPEREPVVLRADHRVATSQD
jgi:hypothetical protein